MAVVRNLQGQHDQALALLSTSLDITIKALGPEHASAATS